MSRGSFSVAIFVGVILVALGLSAFTVNERELAIKLQLGKVVDVVAITDLTSFDHIEREFVLCKVNLNGNDRSALEGTMDGFNARVLDDNAGHYTVECIGGSQEIDRFIGLVAGVGELTTVVRSGAMAVARGAPVFGRG
mgnify:CR=1 FL=1